MSTGNISARVRVDGKFFRLGEQKFYPKGVTYGPFAPNSDGDFFASREQTVKDFQQSCDWRKGIINGSENSRAYCSAL